MLRPELSTGPLGCEWVSLRCLLWPSLSTTLTAVWGSASSTSSHKPPTSGVSQGSSEERIDSSQGAQCPRGAHSPQDSLGAPHGKGESQSCVSGLGGVPAGAQAVYTVGQSKDPAMQNLRFPKGWGPYSGRGCPGHHVRMPILSVCSGQARGYASFWSR